MASGKKKASVEPEAPREERRVRPEKEPEPTLNAEGEDTVLRNIEAACHGNRYLEAMVLGEILNSPRF